MTTEAPDKQTEAEENTEPRFGKDDYTPDFNPTEDKSLTDGQLAKKEAGVGDSSKDKADSTEKDQLGRGFSGEEKPGSFSKFRKRLTINVRKKMMIGGAIGVLGFGGAAFFSIAQGPLHAVHLLQILGTNDRGQEITSEIRTKGLLRFYRTGDIGETRLGRYGSKTFAKTIDQLKLAGIEFPDRNPLTGTPRGNIVIDATAENSILKDVRAEDMKNSLTKTLKISDPSLIKQISPTRFTIPIDAGTRAGMTLISNNVATSVSALGDGRIVTAVNKRYLKKAFGIPGLFAPLTTPIRALDENLSLKALSYDERRAQERIRTNKIRSPVVARAAAAKISLKNSLDGKQGILAATLIGPDALCIVRNVAGAAIAVNYASIVLPAMVEAIDKMAVGAQSQSGELDIAEVGTVVETFEDENGNSIWGARALDATAGNNVGKGEEIPSDYSQAFSSDTTASNIISATDLVILGFSAGAILCSPAGQAASAAANFVALIAAAPTGGASLALYSAKQGALAAATAGVLFLLQKHFTKVLSGDEILPESLSGPLGGNLLAYGARSASNATAMASGGVALKGSRIASFDREQQLEDKKEFQSRSFFARTFDVKDYRSLASRAIDNTSTKPTKNITSIARYTVGLSNNIPGLFSKADAAGEAYDWGFERYGIPKEILNDSKYEDPYVNGDEAVKLFEEGEHIEKAKNCFGVNIVKSPEGWDAVAEKDVNPNDAAYLNENCGDTADEKWVRVMLFVLDTRLMTSIACYDGVEEACADLGIGQVTAQTTSTPPSTPAGSSVGIPSGTAQELAQKLLDYKAQGKYNCDNPIDCEDLTLMTQNQSIRGGVGCITDSLDIRVLQLLVYLVENDYKIGTYALCRAHSLNGGAHPRGRGVDISSINGVGINTAASRSLTLEVDSLILGLTGTLAPRQIISGGVGSTRVVDPEFVRFNRVAPGVEGQAAVSAFGPKTMAGHTNHIHVGY